MNQKAGLFVMIFVTVLAVMGWAYQPQSAQAAEWVAKVDPWVMETAVAQSQTEFLVYLTTQADLSGAESLKTKEAKGQYVYDQLTAVAHQTQPAIIAQLDALGVVYKSFWVANMIWVRADVSVVQAMASRSDVAHIYANPSVALDEPTITDEQELVRQALAVEWNITHVGAPTVWAAGYTGQGVTIGGQDTGYDWDHPALINQYRGWNGATADHNYNWHDAIHVNNGICLGDSPEPCDDHNHGTHTMGTMVGDDGGSNQIGMAPGAKWIGCRNMNAGNGTPASYSECYQWFIAPTDLNDQNPDPNMAPHVINNSWSCPPSEGCTDPNVMLTIVNNVVAAGIVTAHSAGNSGSSCSTISSPAGIYDASYTVGATNSSDIIASFSSRGPITVDSSNRLKPDIAAPGVNIRSSVRGGSYQSGWNGTSMAAPHVAGLVGLLISAAPDLAGDVPAIETLINGTAVGLTTAQGCGGDGPTDVPNNVYGWGRIDAMVAYNRLIAPPTLALSKSVSATVAEPGDLLTYTITTTNTHPVSGTTGVILSDTLPTGTSFITATMPHTWDGNVVTWQTASLAANTGWTVNMIAQVTLTETGTITNFDYAVHSTEAPTSVSGEPVVTQILDYALLLTKETAVTTAMLGDLITYTLTVSNPHDTNPLTNLTLTDTLPVSTTLITVTTPFTVNANTVRWDRASLNAGDSWTVALVVQVPMSTTLAVVENSDYGASSNEVSGVTGPTIITTIAYPMSNTLYLPFVTRPNQPPNAPTNPSPVDGMLNQPISVTLSWEASDPDGDNLTYDVYFEASNSTPSVLIASGLITPSHTLPDNLSEGVSHYWHVVAIDEHGATTDGPTWHFTTLTTVSTFASVVIDLVNQERDTAGCNPVTANAQLTAAALGHSTDMALNDFTSHTGSDGSSPEDRVTAAGYDFISAGENIAWGFTTPQSVMAWWMGDPPHRAQILDCSFAEIGVGYYFLENDTGNNNFHHYWTQVFATPAAP